MHPLLAAARRLGIHPKRSLGQNFLLDDHHLARIADAARLSPTDNILEIGPGLGALTIHLARRAGHVVAVELDDRLIEFLRGQFGTLTHVEIVHGDILELDPAQVIARLPYKVVANLPYYITSPILRHLLECAAPPVEAVLMVQKEVAERICAEPGKLSILAVSVQFYAQPQIVHRVPAGAFTPAPKVDSAVLHLALRNEPAVPQVAPADFFRVVRAGFGQKRKQLGNSLSANLAMPKEQALAGLAAAHIDPRRRAETLSLDEWGNLTQALLSA